MSAARGRVPGKEQAMPKNKRVADIADEVLEPQARDRSEWTGEPFEEALKAVVETEAGRQLEELGDGPHSGEWAQEWQENIRHQERHRAQGRAR
jgi:hypothetical protein